MAILSLLLFSGAVRAQKQVYNIQHYCIDEKPLKHTGCDIEGNEYSFLFVDPDKKQVTLFLSDTKMAFAIVGIATDETSGSTVYTLRNTEGTTQLTVNKPQNNIVLSSPVRRITLKAGKSTKME
jgi:hypothetical protein